MCKCRKSIKRFFLILLSVIMIMSSMDMTAFASESVSSLEGVTRISGQDRYATSLLVADTYKEILGIDKFQTVIIATGLNFADALSAPYLAYVKKAPILLTDGTDDNVSALHEYISANVVEGGKVYIIGGEGAVSASVAAIEGFDVVRISSYTRYMTNLEILEEAGLTSKTLIVASGREYDNGLSALALGHPILLVNTTLIESQMKFIENSELEEIYIIGDTASVSEAVEESLKEYDVPVYRITEEDYVTTSVAVAETFFNAPAAAVVTHADVFVYGLCGVPLAAELKVPLLLANETDKNPVVNYTTNNSISAGYVISTEYKLSDRTIADIFSLADTEEILLKGTRYEDDITPPEKPSYNDYIAYSASVKLSWGACSSEDFQKYEVFNSDTGEILKETTDTNAVILGLEPDTTYTFGVRAVDFAGNQSSAVSYTFTTEKGTVYKIFWDTNGDGNIDDTTDYSVGETPAHTDGYKPADDQYTYTFTGWSPSITAVTTDILYTAQFDKAINKYTIRWDIDGDGEIDETTECEYGAIPAHEDVSKAADAQYTYSFTGWNPSLTAVTGEKTYTAQFGKTVNKYTISWDTDGDGEIDETTEYEYGVTPAHEDVSKEADAQYTYTFTGWSPSLTAVTGNETYTAQFGKTVNKYTISWDTNGDGEIDETTEYEYGETPAHEDTSKEADAQYTYSFTGWSPSLTAVTGNKTYTAQFDKAVNKYTISWDTDGDGEIDETAEYEYGETPVHEDTSKEADAQYSYTFQFWVPSITPVTGNKTYTAYFGKNINHYSISWDTDGNGVIDDVTKVAYGSIPTHNTGFKEADIQYTYTFTGWSPSLTAVTGEKTYTAQFGKTVNKYNISWDTDGNGVIDDVTKVAYGSMPAHNAGVKAADAQYTYTFTGWSPSLTAVTGDKTYTAQFDKAVNRYTISWDVDGDGKIDEMIPYEYGETPVHDNTYKDADAQYSYTFTGWSPSLTTVTGDKTYTAQFDKVVNRYTISWDVDGDGKIDETSEYEYGETPVHEDASKEDDDLYTYTFTGWSPSLTAVTGNKTYTAQFEQKEIITEPEIPKIEGVIRIAGKARYDTGYAVANALKTALGVEKFEAVVVATGKNFADALAGSYLAVEKNAPILLTNGNDSNVAELHAYIKANVEAGGKVYILGGEGAVPKSVEALQGYDVVRLSGSSRYDTNLAILAEAGITGDSIIIATGKNFADSLSASAAKLPILLVKPNSTLNDAQKEFLSDITNIYIIGGEGAVSTAYEKELQSFGNVIRVYGKSRYDTSVEVAKTFCKDVETAVLASGKNFPDGLCGGPLAAALNAPLILTKDGGADSAASYVSDNEISDGYVLGGTGALADETVVEVFSLEGAEEIL